MDLSTSMLPRIAGPSAVHHNREEKNSTVVVPRLLLSQNGGP